MFNFGKRRRRRRDDIRADIGSVADEQSEFSEQDPEEAPDMGPAAEAAATADANDGYDEEIPESIPEDQKALMRESRRARREAQEKSRRDDQTRQTVFACACVVAGFCGVAGVIFGTAMACRNLASGPGLAAASTSTTAPYVQGVDPSDMNIYYDQSGRMHVNVYLEKQPDVDVNIRIDGSGNVTTETVPREEGDPADAPSDDGANAGEDAQLPGGDPADAPQDGDDANEGSGSSDPDNETGEGAGDGAEEGDEGGQAAEKTEAQLLAEMREREAAGGSGYLETDEEYIVQRGDTLTIVSSRTGFSVDFLAQYNHLKDKNLIITGEVLRYPSFRR